MANNKKIQVKDQWAERFLREYLWMPVGSFCNLVGQAYQGKGINGINEEELEKLTRKIFSLALEFTEEAFNRVERTEEDLELPVKK
uniref:Uncharacterized protein n=1 Tax=candidate division CPR3 bacterium TaxID=2268181 RepID=A0A7V3N5E1_UNCC3